MTTVDEEITQIKKDLGLLAVLIAKNIELHSRDHEHSGTNAEHTRQEKELLKELRSRLQT